MQKQIMWWSVSSATFHGIVEIATFIVNIVKLHKKSLGKYGIMRHVTHWNCKQEGKQVPQSEFEYPFTTKLRATMVLL